MKNPLLPAALAAALLFSACASTGDPPAALTGARAAVSAAEANPDVLRHAPLELKKASDALRRADELSAQRGTLGDIESAAYVASRHAEAAQAAARAKAADDAIKSAQTERERVRADARAAEARQAQGNAAQARVEASNARAEAAVAKAEASEAQQRADTAQASAESAASTALVLQQQLVELKAQQTERGMLVTLGDVLFEFGRAEVKDTAGDSLRKLASYLARFPDRYVLIEGYTDSVGSQSANLSLSQRRAEAVASALAAMGVQPGRLSTRGYGASFPVAENTTDTNRALNRRVEVYVSDSDRPVRARG